MGIRHLCDDKISNDEFQYFLDNLESFKVTEKVDGSNLLFGLDSNGEFYINRDKKDGRKLGNIYPNKTEILGSHFSKYFEVLHYFYRTGAISIPKNSQFEIEIIDDPITNIVPYDPHQIIILDTFGNKININTETIDFSNTNISSFGVDIADQWSIKINKPFKIDSPKIRMMFDGVDRMTALSDMKKQLLDIPSQYGQNNDDSWIEGLVFKSDDLIYKLVNKDRFTVMNKFLHEIRQKISKPRPGINSVGGMFQELMSEIAEVYSMKELATSQRKKWILKNPDWQERMITHDQACYSKNLIAVIGIINKYNKMIKEFEDDYLKNYKNLYIETDYGKCYIDEYTHKKNIEAISYLKVRIKIIEEEIKDDDQSKRVGIWAFVVQGF